MTKEFAGLTDSQIDAFDFSAKRSLIDLDLYAHDQFTLMGYSLSNVLDDILLVQYIDMKGDDDKVVYRNGLAIPLAHTAKAWRIGLVLLAGPGCSQVKRGDFICFPDDKGIKTSNIKVDGVKGTIKNAVFLNENRIFGICKPDVEDEVKDGSESV